ncbi:MAG: energy transducer TonB [Ginsengibacter sp.]
MKPTTKNKDEILINFNEKKITIPENSLIVDNGKEISNKEMKNISPNNILSINILKGGNAIKKYGEKGKDGVLEITTKNDEDITVTADTIYIGGHSTSKRISDNEKFTGNVKFTGKAFYIKSRIPDGTLIFVDGKEISNDEMKNINPDNIQSMSILKGESAIKKYGNKAKDGVIEITKKNKSENLSFVSTDAKTVYGNASSEKNDSIPDKVFTKVENEASFPGGPSAWQKFIVKKIQASLDSFIEADYGTCILKFIVNTDGTISNVEATTMKGTHLANISIEAIKNGPKWIPASQNGKVVAAYRLQPITLTNPEGYEKKSAKT